jgi:hypothetical protein
LISRRIVPEIHLEERELQTWLYHLTNQKKKKKKKGRKKERKEGKKRKRKRKTTLDGYLTACKKSIRISHMFHHPQLFEYRCIYEQQTGQGEIKFSLQHCRKLRISRQEMATRVSPYSLERSRTPQFELIHVDAYLCNRSTDHRSSLLRRRTSKRI